MAKILNLQGLWLDTITYENKIVRAKVRNPAHSARCPNCNESSRSVRQRTRREIKHGNWDGKIVILDMQIRRFNCKNSQCSQHTFREYIPGIDRQRTTNNFRHSLALALSKQSITGASQSYMVSPTISYKVLHNAFMEISLASCQRYCSVGLDEHSFRGRRMALTVTDITNKRLIGLGPNDHIPTVHQHLENLKNKGVDEICIDMRFGYLRAIQDTLPDVIVTVDPFHVVAYANRMLDEVRRIVLSDLGRQKKIKLLLMRGQERLSAHHKEKLDKVFKELERFSALKQMYLIKEKVRRLYFCSSRKEASRYLDDIIMLCDTASSRYIRDFGRSLFRWKEPILNHFINRTTNAFTEGLHTKIKMAKRISFGFRNINNYIAKMTLACNYNQLN